MKRGFTLLEFAIVVSISAILVPLVMTFGRTLESQFHIALATADAAQSARAVTEELRRDLATMRWEADGTSLSDGRGCRVEYVVQDRVLRRRAPERCGGERPVARHVASLTQDGLGVVVAFRRETGAPKPHEISFRLGLAGGLR